MQAASTEVVATPASEPGSPARGKKNAESRIQELLTERAQLRADLEAAKRPAPASVPDVPAASSPAPMAGEKFPAYDAWIATQSADVQNASDAFDLYIDARAGHVFQRQQMQARQREADDTAQREEQGRFATYRQQADTFATQRTDYWSIVEPITEAHIPDVKTRDAIQDVITRSVAAPALLYHLGTHRDEFARVIALPAHQAAYELGKLDAALSVGATSVRPTKTVSSAPPPPPSLLSRAQTPVDEIESARSSGDWSRYRALANARDIAAAGR